MESTHGTLGDTHILWLLALSAIEKTLFAADGAFTETKANRLCGIINWRFNQTINEPLQDLYILALFGNPSECNTLSTTKDLIVESYNRDPQQENLPLGEPPYANYSHPHATRCRSELQYVTN
jgi:hypothetical protein